MTEKKKIWFVIRRMGWSPCCWQGWAVSLIFIALIIVIRALVNPEHYMLYALLLVAGFISICIAKGGRHRRSKFQGLETAGSRVDFAADPRRGE
ncbi:MAG: hypothetical protein WC047_06810 [Kiritimatiellales bacterium]